MGSGETWLTVVESLRKLELFSCFIPLLFNFFSLNLELSDLLRGEVLEKFSGLFWVLSKFGPFFDIDLFVFVEAADGESVVADIRERNLIFFMVVFFFYVIIFEEFRAFVLIFLFLLFRQ